MALIDFRVQPSFFRHRKTRLLRAACGDHGVICLLTLWGYAAEMKADGNLAGLSDRAIEIEAGWDRENDEPGKFISQIRNTDSRFLDDFQLHDWEEHQAWLMGRKARSEKAKKAAKAKYSCSEHATSIENNDNSILQASSEHATSNEKPRFSSAPSPSPSPSPLPELDNKSNSEIDPTNADRQNQTELDWLYKAFTVMAKTSPVMEMDILQNGDLKIKLSGWLKKANSKWAMFQVSRFWKIARMGCTNGEDPISKKGIEQPMSYIYKMIFPQEFGQEPVFDYGDCTFTDAERVTMEMYYNYGFDERN